MAEIVSIKRSEDPQKVLVREDGPVLRVTLNNPPTNALSREVLGRLGEALERAAGERALRCVVLAASGPVFSAGHDLKELTAHRSDTDGGRAFFSQTFAACAALMQAVVRSPKPIIAAVDGLATAAGLQLVASCDLAIASSEATFCAPGVNIGLFCSTPAVALARSIGSKQAMEMLLTGETIDAPTAREWGLVNRVVPREYLGQVVSRYAAAIAAKSPATIALGKAAFHRQREMELSQAYDFASGVMVENMLAPEAVEGIDAFLGKREPNWPGS